MRKSDYPRVLRRWVAVMVILLFLCLLVPVAMAQTWPNCDWDTNCTWDCKRNDVVINRSWLGYCINGTPIEPCTAGTPVPACIWAEFYCKKDDLRSQIYTFFDVYIDGDYNESDCACIDNISATTTYIGNISGTFNWICGQEVELRNITISWQNEKKKGMQLQ